MKTCHIITDQAIIALDLRLLLSSQCQVISTIKNSSEAAQNDKPDVDFIVMDSDVSGSFDGLKNIITALRCGNTRSILISSQPQIGIPPDLKYSNYFSKPFDPQAILRAVND